MADFGGFNLKTPEEVLAGLAAQRQQIAMLPPAQQRNANIQFQLQGIFGNPELQKAKRLEGSMEQAQKAVPKDLTKGSLDYEQARLSAMFDAVKDLDPVAASQIATKLTMLDEEKFERDRLKAQSARADRQIAMQERESNARATALERNNILNDRFVIADVSDPAKPKLKYYNPGDIADMAEFEARAKKGGDIRVLNREEAARLSGHTEALGDLWNKSAINTKTQSIQANGNSFRRASRLIDILSANPGANTSTASFQGVLADAAQEAKTVLRKGSEVTDGLNDSQAKAKISSALEQAGLFTGPDARDRATMEAIGLNMAYSLARSLDPSGRLSDADVQFAARMLASSRGDPTIIGRVLTEQMSLLNRDTTSMVMSDIGPDRAGDNGQASLIRRHYDSANTEYENYLKKVEQSGLLAPEDYLRITGRTLSGTPASTQPAGNSSVSWGFEE